MNILFRLKKRNASVLLLSLLSLEIIMGCLLIELNTYEKQVIIVQELSKEYQDKIAERIKGKINFVDS